MNADNYGDTTVRYAGEWNDHRSHLRTQASALNDTNLSDEGKTSRQAQHRCTQSRSPPQLLPCHASAAAYQF